MGWSHCISYIKFLPFAFCSLLLFDRSSSLSTSSIVCRKECEKLKEAQHQEAMRKTSTMNSIDFPSKAAQRSTNDPNMSAIGSEDLQVLLDFITQFGFQVRAEELDFWIV